MQVEHYLNSDGRDLLERWLDRIRDRRALVAIERRIARIERDGYFGDHKYLREGVSELRIDEGAGYRVYTPRPTMSSSCCSVGATSPLRTRTLVARSLIGKIFSDDGTRAAHE
jgi:putative addiction module killer protein